MHQPILLLQSLIKPFQAGPIVELPPFFFGVFTSLLKVFHVLVTGFKCDILVAYFEEDQVGRGKGNGERHLFTFFWMLYTEMEFGNTLSTAPRASYN
jgi:hypothetical protein